MFCTRKLQFFGIVHCCTPEDPFFFPVCQSVLAHVHVLVVCALSTVLVGLLVPRLQCIVCNVRCHVNTNLQRFLRTMLLAGSSFLVCKVCVRCHVNIDLQHFLRVHRTACWFFIPRLQSVCLLSCQHHLQCFLRVQCSLSC